MPITISTEFGLKHADFMKAGVLDGCLDTDVAVFIDPAMVAKSVCPELKGARGALTKHFNEVILLLENSKTSGDKMWRTAEEKLTFPELRQLCIGYGRGGTAGSGIGSIFAKQLIESAAEIMAAGVKEPEIFELAGLFEEGIGADRISDMTGGLLADRIAAFTVRMAAKLKIPCKTTYKTASGNSYKVPFNQYGNKALLLLPLDVLRDLPVALDAGDIENVCRENDAIRSHFNSLLGSEWKMREIRKRELKEQLLENPEALKKLVALYRKKNPATYDFASDPASLIHWAWVQELTSASPLALTKPKRWTHDTVHGVVLKICHHFADILQNNGINKLLFVGTRPRPESYAQKLFFCVAAAYCGLNDLDLSPESNAGRGPVDFKVSAGASAKTLVEMKLSKNSKLVAGFTKQLPTYAKSEKSGGSIYLVVNLGRKKDKGPMETLLAEFTKAKPPKPTLVVAEAKLQRSASKL